MAKAWPTPVAPAQDLPRCEYPGCGRPAPYGYGCTLRSRGRHFCGAHRPSVQVAIEEPAPAAEHDDLFAPRARRR